ncbi:putative carnitinyl-CoA dehydratase [Hypoxylon argillaceum]|nr:putative carnitinyl-CoA dehydratase [Hypoxylon argillaceum]
MASTELFSVPIPARPSHPGGSIVCTTPAPKVYLLTFTSPPDNRLTPEFCGAMMAALDIVEFEQAPGVVVTTSGIPKFYSNGLDLPLALATPGFWAGALYPLLRRFLTFPMPTVALLNGHAFAGGIILAMHHDYRVFTGRGRGFACVNELEFGAPLPPPLAGIFRLKTAPHVYRELVLEAKRFDGKAALEAGLVDAVGELEAVLKLVEERKLVVKGTKGSYGLLKAEMYRESIALLDVKDVDVPDLSEVSANLKKRKADGKERVKKWRENQGQKAKL